jgi:hypothetical protein
MDLPPETIVCNEIMTLMGDLDADPMTARAGILQALLICFVDDGLEKKRALKVIGTMWDKYESPIKQALALNKSGGH